MGIGFGSLFTEIYVGKEFFLIKFIVIVVRHFFSTILISIFTRDENNTLKYDVFFHSCSTTITINLIKKNSFPT
jgi:hypothetical protein